MHILEGLMKALNNIDQTIATIRSNPRNAEAKLALMELLEIDEVQAGKILEITLSKLTQGEVANYQAEYNQCKVDIDGFEKILSDKQELLKVIVAETNEQIDVFLDDKDDNGKKVYELRRSQWTHDEIKLTKEDIVAKENCAVLLSKQGYVRRLSSADLKEQQRGTQGSQQIELAKQDSLAISTECFSHDTLAFITSLGRVAFTRAFEVDTSMRGQHINNIIKLDEENNEQVIKIQSIDMDIVRAASEKQLVIVTEKGVIKRSDFELFNPSRQVTVKAINLMDKDSIAFFDICSPDDQITIVTTGNRVVRYPLTQVRKTSRSSRGIIAVKLEGNAKVVACSTASPAEVSDTVMFMVSTGGLMKLSMLESIREVSRGCKGVLGMKLEEGDSILNAFNVKESEIEHTDIVTITKQGKVNRVAANEFRVRSRVTMGVRLARTKDGDELISAYPITTTPDDDVEVE
jgi:DNA gyrase subunit A